MYLFDVKLWGERRKPLKRIDINHLTLNCGGRDVTLLKGSIFIYLTLYCWGRDVTLLKGPIFISLTLNCE